MLLKDYLFFLLLCLCAIGCAGDDGIPIYDDFEANFVSAIPPGGEIPVNATITVTFDDLPFDVKVRAGAVTVAGKTATITGPFTPGPLVLAITWHAGGKTLAYRVTPHDCCGFLDGIRITGGTVKDGDKDVDAEVINTDGIIIIEFGEDVTGLVALQTERGEDVGWIGKVEGNKAILELVKGRELITEITYVIRGKVSDAAGNAREVSITFVTLSDSATR